MKRGWRNEDGTGVLVGLTKIVNVVGYERIPGGGLKPIPGKLFYRGYDVDDLAHALSLIHIFVCHWKGYHLQYGGRGGGDYLPFPLR